MPEGQRKYIKSRIKVKNHHLYVLAFVVLYSVIYAIFVRLFFYIYFYLAWTISTCLRYRPPMRVRLAT